MDDKVLTREERCRIILDKYDDLIPVAQRILGNLSDSEDVVQMAAMLFLDENKQPKSQNWLYPTTARLAYELIKHKRRSIPRGAIPDIESTVLDPSQIVLDRDAKETMYTAIAMLKPGYRAMLTLFYIEGVNLKEGAEILGITPGAFANRLHRARRQLKAILLA